MITTHNVPFKKISLKNYHTFSLSVEAHQLIMAEDIPSLLRGWQYSQESNKPFLLLGEGSNVLFLEDFSGIVLLNRIKGIAIKEDSQAWRLHIGAGENWHQLVCYTLEHGMAGLENLALIPGCVGTAPIQNIGAYGIELKDVCEYVDVLDLHSGNVQRMAAEVCAFGYRESIFKHHYRDSYAVVAVGLRLNKVWKPILNYGELTRLAPESVTPQQIFNTVCHMRRSKLPDPAITGNAGSFFKNPLVNANKSDNILLHYPNAPHYPQADGQVKYAAGWLIDQCSLKGYQIGGAAVHQQQALVLINQGNASGQDIVNLARYIRASVAAKFDIWLEPEVRFIAANGEVDAIGCLG